jgi:hypothetical protein
MQTNGQTGGRMDEQSGAISMEQSVYGDLTSPATIKRN